MARTQNYRSQVEMAEHLFGIFNSKDGMIQVRVVAYRPEGDSWKAPKIEFRRRYKDHADGSPNLGGKESMSLELFEELMSDDQKGWDYLCSTLGKAKEWYLKQVEKLPVKGTTSTAQTDALNALIQRQEQTEAVQLQILQALQALMPKPAAPTQAESKK